MEKMDIVRGNAVFIYEKCCSSGIKMIADKVRGDISKVFGDTLSGFDFITYLLVAFITYAISFGFYFAKGKYKRRITE